jgi:16S rRNA (cytosine967-C5)-methyltransferase
MPEWLLERWDRQFGPETANKIAAAFLEPAETHVAGTGRIQDIGAQSIVPFLDLHPGQTFLDLCAAPGNKTAQAIACGVRAVACDIHLHRLRQMRDLNCPLVVLDGTRPLPFRGKFDRILVDAPCSGTGTLGRNPEIKWRLQPSDLADLHAKQVALVRRALERLCPGGRLVYSTCSLEKEENEQVIEEIGGAWQTSQRLPGLNPGDGFFAAVR